MNRRMLGKVEEHFAKCDQDPMAISTRLLEVYELHQLNRTLEELLITMQTMSLKLIYHKSYIASHNMIN